MIFLAVLLITLVITNLISNNNNFFEFGLIFLTFFVPALIGLIYSIKLTHQSTAVVPEAYHDAKKLLMLLDIKADEATDFTKLNEMLAQSVDLMNLQLPEPHQAASNTASAAFEKFIKRAIESVKNTKSNTKVISNITFTDKHEVVNDIKIAYILGLLLEHALDTLTKRPIFIDVSSARHNAIIQISCEYKFERRLRRIENFLLDNDEDIRSKIKRNFNLLKLKTLVDAHNGKIIITREKNEQEQLDYLSICIVFKKEGDSFG